MIRILIACERSGVVRRAFNAHPNVEAWSCDLEPAEDGDPRHHIGDALQFMAGSLWDCVIAHPPCTRLCNSGVRWLAERNLWSDLSAACEFFNAFKGAAPFVAIENPIPHCYARWRIGRYDQLVQPWQFGHGETKATCLWLYNLPPLQPTNVVPGRVPRVHLLGSRGSVERSRTYDGIAHAMAQQWLPVIQSNNNRPK